MIAISATITFWARFLSHDVAVGALLGFIGSIAAIDSAKRHLRKRPVDRPAIANNGWRCRSLHEVTLRLGYSALIRSSAPLGQSWPYLSRYFFWANVRNALRSGV